MRVGESSIWKDKVHPLARLDIELTERCNNDCIHCCINLPADDHEAKERELSTEEIKGILMEAASLGCLAVRFTGGEALLREDFEELYLFSRRLGFEVIIFTNATLITPEIAELFARIPPLRNIEVSVYGMKKSSYEAVTRAPGSFEAAWRGINLLLGKGIPFVVKGAILPPTRGELKEFDEWALTIPWMDGPPSNCMFFDLRVRQDSERKNRLIRSLRVSPLEGLEIITRWQEMYLKDMEEFCSKFLGLCGDQLFVCGSGAGSVALDAYGCLQACLELRHPDTVYDLKNGSLKDALTNFFPSVRQMKAKNPDYLTRCARCFLKSLCQQCPAKSCMEHGTLDTPVEHFCEVAHAQARYLGILREGETAWTVEDWRERIAGFAAERTVPEESKV
jgi:radical SAM protein with 4Fe4S-binding SPASM domain